MKPFLAETCLLTHGLKSVPDSLLESAWPKDADCLAWIEDGSVRTGSIRDYLPFRSAGRSCGRISCFNFQHALDQRLSGALTASGTMEACRRAGLQLAVTCGTGGIGNAGEGNLSADLPALRDIPVTLIATSPKDVLDISETLDWLIREGVCIRSADSDRCTGYLFLSADYPLPRLERLPEKPGRLLILNGIPEKNRIRDLSLIPAAVREAREKEAEGKPFHPAASEAFDRMTDGYASILQLDSFIANILLADRLLSGK